MIKTVEHNLCRFLPCWWLPAETMIVTRKTIIGGRTTYGHALGVLMLDTVFPRLVGDIGNALTWPFPVQYKIVKGARTDRIMGPSPDPGLLEPFILAAKELESEGVRAIATSCGFLAAFQRELAAAVSVPVLTSALLQVRIVSRMVGPSSSVGILTERPNLTEQHFNATRWSSNQFDVHVNALPPNAIFPTVFIDGAQEADVQVLRFGNGPSRRGCGQTPPGYGGDCSGVHQFRPVQCRGPESFRVAGVRHLHPRPAELLGNRRAILPRSCGLGLAKR
jgi:hypothetical protein